METAGQIFQNKAGDGWSRLGLATKNNLEKDCNFGLKV